MIRLVWIWWYKLAVIGFFLKIFDIFSSWEIICELILSCVEQKRILLEYTSMSHSHTTWILYKCVCIFKNFAAYVWVLLSLIARCLFVYSPKPHSNEQTSKQTNEHNVQKHFTQICKWYSQTHSHTLTRIHTHTNTNYKQTSK